jgi:hypothetical protein
MLMNKRAVMPSRAALRGGASPLALLGSRAPLRSPALARQAQSGAAARGRSLGVAPRCSASAVAVRTGPPKREEVITSDPANNVTDYIYEKIGENLHQQNGHPICTIKTVGRVWPRMAVRQNCMHTTRRLGPGDSRRVRPSGRVHLSHRCRVAGGQGPEAAWGWAGSQRCAWAPISAP